jgi:hypothetical protein
VDSAGVITHSLIAAIILPLTKYKPIEHATREHKEVFDSYQRFSPDKREELKPTYELVMNYEPKTRDEWVKFMSLKEMFHKHDILFDQREELLRGEYLDPQIEEAAHRIKRIEEDVKMLKSPSKEIR